ncbi:uncharacterized protein LOC119192319 [Manduca sexta]|nr:uncharacterized protein LOC119192319 [Manduca sexta]
MPRDYCVQSLAQLLQGYGFGVLIELYQQVMTPERIVRLNITPLSPTEFLEALLEKEIEPITREEYQEYTDFFIENSYLKTERLEYDIINKYRDVAYRKMAKQKAAG